MRGAALVASLLFALGACTDRDAPRTLGERDAPPTSGGTASRQALPVPGADALPPGLPDPAEAGISDLARLARYVFREMRRHETDCPLVNPFHDRLSFAIETEVRKARIIRVGLGAAALERDGEKAPLPAAQRPPALEAFVRCLEPHLNAVEMSPSPADGLYEPEYGYPGHPAAP